MNRMNFFGDEIRGILLGLLFTLLGTGRILPLFLIILFFGIIASTEGPRNIEEQAPKKEIHPLSTESLPFAMNQIQTYQLHT